jgi:capsular polysaccharide biosynthesis protein
MANSECYPDRLSSIHKLLRILQEDAPWVSAFHPIGFGLYHEWYLNAYPNLMANNTLKYKRIDPELRMKSRNEWNQPILWPLFLISIIAIISIVPIAVKIYRKNSF